MDIRNDTRLKTRFFKRVEPSGNCEVWTGSINRGGYGSINIAGRTLSVHRIAYALAHGPFDESMHVDHTCFNRACVKPSHLRLATREQNAENREGATRLSKSGIRGVSWHAQSKKWWATCGKGGRKYSGGLYNTLEEADIAARELRNRVFTFNINDRRAS